MPDSATGIRFRKLSGAGNTFVVVAEGDLPDGVDRVDLARTLSAPDGPADGADGLIVVGSGDSDDRFTMDYYNSDGSTGMMCGNGGRCALRFAVDSGMVAPRGRLTFTNAGVEYHGEMVEGEVAVSFPDPLTIRTGIETDLEALPVTLHFVDVGTPHLLLFMEDAPGEIAGSLDELDIDRWGPVLRHHAAAGPLGANANFLELLPDRSGLRLRTFERGVEGETGACGTGAIASGLLGAILHPLRSPVRIIPTSGDPLHISFTRTGDDQFTDLTLQGPATVLMEGEFHLNNPEPGVRAGD